ncbi:MAG: P-type conjugative transfer ATPase TrbB [Hyphomonas sp.]|uniref:P-type conjugative transfer ATPase TrbB n=1 Tax=Hyphomonas sp. TaxID=87 RepID=UPI001839CCA7|nr:P-type conjugative transfer ATPase TrbB [Hyphomonas sp.]MBU3919335.1 P-type conjugative transfer ATPase TrbB [Alphaproteobacteria bacterium]MBA3069122.1 P-type conjugative transfer ATPase TrbB [Hyphomonas sp.]MBU4061537.1 P-type conjugative transfer ATPase TrbB [Alphaproteobacteria bacterium]MBU4165395.1 P-type conjugative transfer ATPase TrbB [Alphaproteobacteria bacterium]MBU4568591.1 P-type conjugative transfer ATPase TrbB [Alphaproteobacteria bacterium]
MTCHSICAETNARQQAMLQSALKGPVRRALDSSDTLEILANPDGSVWIERAGLGLMQADERLEAPERDRIIRLVASAAGEPCDRNTPIVSAEMPGTGERFEGILPPVSEAPCFSIRKPAATPFGLDDYVRSGALAPATALALRQALQARQNIVIAGGTSSGKTTFANALLAEPALAGDRIVILEDTRELRCRAPDVTQLRTYRSAVTLRDLVRSTLRLRPDRIVVGEVRGGEALDLLKAWNTGHPGGLTTLHANSASGVFSRLENLVAEATATLPFSLIGEAIDIIVFLSRRSGERRVEEALRVTGFDENGYRTQPLTAPNLAAIS